jgi:hypothetical protein
MLPRPRGRPGGCQQSQAQGNLPQAVLYNHNRGTTTTSPDTPRPCVHCAQDEAPFAKRADIAVYPDDDLVRLGDLGRSMSQPPTGPA